MSEPDASTDVTSSSQEPAAPKKDKRPRDPELWVHRPMEKYRKGKGAFLFRPGPDFFALADPVVQTQRTLLGYDRLYSFWQAIQNVASLPGEVVEVGAYRGGSSYFIASAFVAATGAEASFHVFDTFEGHPAAAITAEDPFHTAGQFDGTSYDDVRAYLSPFERVQIHRGDMLTILPTLPESMYRLVHLDTDLYAPTKAGLEYFGARMPSGGVFVLDDYASAKCPGVRAALAEFMNQTDAFQAWDLRTEQLLLVKH
jgi:hypothetical protein